MKKISTHAFNSACMEKIELPDFLELFYAMGNFIYCKVIIIPDIKMEGELVVKNNQKIIIKSNNWRNGNFWTDRSHGIITATIYYLSSEAPINPTKSPDLAMHINVYCKFDFKDTDLFGYPIKRELSSNLRVYETSTGGYGIAEILQTKSGYYTIPKTIPEKVSSVVDELGPNVFNGWNELMEITIPNTIKTICDDAFSGCSELMSVIFESESSLITIKSKAFKGTLLESFAFPNSVKNIGANIFESCQSLTSISLPAKVTTIDSGAFNGCTTLNEFTINPNENAVDGYDGCTSISGKLIISEGINSIGNGCFSKSSIKSVNFPSTLLTIGMASFYQCRSLDGTVVIPFKVNSIGANAFKDCPLNEVYYCGETQITNKAFGAASNLKRLYVNQNFPSDTFCGIKAYKVLNDECIKVKEPEIDPSTPTPDPSKPTPDPSKPTSDPVNPTQENIDNSNSGGISTPTIIAISSTVVILTITIALILAISFSPAFKQFME